MEHFVAIRSKLVCFTVLFAIAVAGCCGGCAHIMAHAILTAGSNGGGTPFPKRLDKAPFDQGFWISVQENPSVKLMVWVIEPRPYKIWMEDPAQSPVSDNCQTDANIYAYAKVDDGRIIKMRKVKMGKQASAESVGTIIVLQGQGGCARTSCTCFFIAHALADAGYRVIMPDLRSQGDSTGTQLGFIVKDAADLSLLIDELERRELVVGKLGALGHSYGAAVVGYTALQDDRIAACVLSGSPMNWREVIEFQGRDSWIWQWMTKGQKDKTFEICSEVMGYDIDSFDASKLAAKMSTPILLIHGEDDKQVPVSHAVTTYEARPAASKLVIYANAGHGNYHLTQFDNFNSLCVDWFAVHLQGQGNPETLYGRERR